MRISAILKAVVLTFVLATMAIVVSPGRATAQATSQATSSRRADSTAALAAAQNLLAAISTRDAMRARPLMLPGAQLVSVNDPASATTGPRMQTDSAFLATLAAPGPKYLERMWEPTLFLQGPIAIIHAPYDFHIDGVFSHCGVDTFTLEKAQGAWRVSHIAYTVQRTGCAPSPLGAP